MTIRNPETIKKCLKAKGVLEDMTFDRIYQYESALGGELQFALFQEIGYDDMNGNRYVKNAVLLMDRPNLTDAGKAFLEEHR